eukprot:gene23249-biopygen1244
MPAQDAVPPDPLRGLHSADPRPSGPPRRRPARGARGAHRMERPARVHILCVWVGGVGGGGNASAPAEVVPRGRRYLPPPLYKTGVHARDLGINHLN